MVLETLQQLLAEQLGVDSERITPDTSLEEDLGADAFDRGELMLAIEDAFDMEDITEEQAQAVQTVGDILRLLGAEDEIE